MDYDYIKNQYRLIAIDLSRQKKLDADPKVIQQIEFVGRLKKLDDDDNATDETGNDQYMFVITILEKIKETRLKFYQGSKTVLHMMPNYQEARVKLTGTQLNKLKSAAENKTGKILRIKKKNFEDEELQHELFLATRQTNKMRNAFANNMSLDMKLSKAQISEIIHSCLGKLGKKVLTNIAIPFARDDLPGLVRNLTSNTINKFERKISGREL